MFWDFFDDDFWDLDLEEALTRMKRFVAKHT